MSQTDYLLAEVAWGVSVSDWSGHRNLAGCGVDQKQSRRGATGACDYVRHFVVVVVWTVNVVCLTTTTVNCQLSNECVVFTA